MIKLVLAGALALSLAACGGADSSSRTEPILPEVAAATFVSGIDHPYFPLPVGARWVYEAATDEGLERIEVTVTGETRRIQGVTATVVRDTVTIDGEVVEDTSDWYDQDSDGNVWYLGEDTCVYENGACVDHEGSWEWGQQGALPGFAMPARPALDGGVYRQELYAGHAEDTGEVIAVGVSVTTSAGTFRDCIQTHDASTLDASLDERKTYCPGVGLVMTEEGDVTEELVEMAGL